MDAVTSNIIFIQKIIIKRGYMKRILLSLLCMTALICICACSQDSLMSSKAAITEQDSLPLLPSMYYETVEELSKSILDDFSQAALSQMEREMSSESVKSIRDFIEGRKKDNIIYVPFYQEQACSFMNREGFHNITIYPFELYERAWVLFDAKLDDAAVSVKTLYLDFLSENTLSEAKNKGASWLIRQIASEAPNIYNVDSYPDYANIYEKSIELQDKSVTALVKELKDSEIIHVDFIYKNMLVSLVADSNTLTPELYAELSLGSVELDK